MNKSSYPSFFCTGILLGYTMYERDELFPLKDNGTSLGSHHSNNSFEQKSPVNDKISEQKLK